LCLGEVAAGIAAFVLKGDLKTVIQTKMKEGMQNYGTSFLYDNQEYLPVILFNKDCHAEPMVPVHKNSTGMRTGTYR
jgi:hypothetical protein